MPELPRRTGGRPASPTLIAFNKPYGVLSQFTSADGKPTLADYIAVRDVYPAGRLDVDSEGLLLLTDDGPLQRAISDGSRGIAKRYLAQVEGIPSPDALARFASGLVIGDGADRYRAKPAEATSVDAPVLAPRVPPIRIRAAIPTSWLAVTVREGRNRQVRRMTAAIGHPTLRLVRVAIGALELSSLAIEPGAWVAVAADAVFAAGR